MWFTVLWMYMGSWFYLEVMGTPLTLHSIIQLIWSFCTKRWWGPKNIFFHLWHRLRLWHRSHLRHRAFFVELTRLDICILVKCMNFLKGSRCVAWHDECQMSNLHLQPPRLCVQGRSWGLETWRKRGCRCDAFLRTSQHQKLSDSFQWRTRKTDSESLILRKGKCCLWISEVLQLIAYISEQLFTCVVVINDSPKKCLIDWILILATFLWFSYKWREKEFLFNHFLLVC